MALLGAGQLRMAMLLGSRVCNVAVTFLFHDLLRAVNRNISGLAATVSLVGCALSILIDLGSSTPGMNPLVFFGCYCLLIGYLIFRSAFLPCLLGVLLACAGLGWLTFLSPAGQPAGAVQYGARDTG